MPHRLARRGPPYDLFGEIPVTWDEVWDWVETVAGIDRRSWRACYYIEWWNVPDKIRAEKLGALSNRPKPSTKTYRGID
jgi:hypothetical protein